MFKIKSSFKPKGDQPQAIKQIVNSLEKKIQNQVLLGVTGSGKTFTVANVIQQTQKPALIISHNKTLAGQLYQEFRDFFPNNAVSYYVSYYDYYQPEAYMPTTDTYIEKESDINEFIDKLRLQSTSNIMSRKDVIVVASVSCIYNIGSPEDYNKFTYLLKIGTKIKREDLIRKLVSLQYLKSEFEFKRGTFRTRGNNFDIYPSYEDFGIKLIFEDEILLKYIFFNPISGKELNLSKKEDTLTIFPSKQYLIDNQKILSVENQIRKDLELEYDTFKKQGKDLEANRLLKRVNYDLEMLKEIGYVNGIENYSRYFDHRAPGDPPYSLVDFFKKAYGDDFLVIIDESHMTIPQIRGMYNGDHSRKKTLIDFGFRLKAAFDNRPLKFEEFDNLTKYKLFVSATPSDWEIQRSSKNVVEQLIRPTGILDPKITIRPSETEVDDVVKEVKIRVKKKQRVLITTLTKKTAEDLTDYLKDQKINCAYLHSDIKTLERSDILDSLRNNKFDVLIGVNLLREGLDLPEVTLVAILDADKEGFLRSKTALIQTMGRAARNIEGEVIIYADKITKSIQEAIKEVDRRRNVQKIFNKKYNIDPKTIYKPIREKIINQNETEALYDSNRTNFEEDNLIKIKAIALTSYDKKKLIKRLRSEMKNQAENLNFEYAIKIRDKILELKK